MELFVRFWVRAGIRRIPVTKCGPGVGSGHSPPPAQNSGLCCDWRPRQASSSSSVGAWKLGSGQPEWSLQLEARPVAQHEALPGGF